MINFNKFSESIQKVTSNVEIHAGKIRKDITFFAEQASGFVTEKVEETFELTSEQAKSIQEIFNANAPLDEIGRKIASLGTPAIIFAVAASIAGGTGLVGGAVVTTALAMLGGPAGMIGGLALLGITTAIADVVGKHGIEKVLLSVYTERLKQDISQDILSREISNLWISDELKRKIQHHIQL